jgi:hypothetical protein
MTLVPASDNGRLIFLSAFALFSVIVIFLIPMLENNGIIWFGHVLRIMFIVVIGLSFLGILSISLRKHFGIERDPTRTWF